MSRFTAFLSMVFALCSTLVSVSAGAAPIRLLFERDTDAAAGVEVALATFDDIAGVVTYSPTSTQFSTVNVTSTFSIRDATWDGTAYRVLFERDTDAAGGVEVAIASFGSLNDIINYNPLSTQFSTVNVTSSFSAGGLTYDGLQYHLLFETNLDTGAGAEVAIASFNSFNDIINYNPLTTQFSTVNVTSTFSIHGFTYDDGLFHLLFERDLDAAAGVEVAIATFASIDAIVAYNPLSTQFSTVNVTSTFNVAGLFADVDFTAGDPGPGDGDDGGVGMPGDPMDDPTPPVNVPEPPLWALFAIGALFLTARSRRVA